MAVRSYRDHTEMLVMIVPLSVVGKRLPLMSDAILSERQSYDKNFELFSSHFELSATRINSILGQIDNLQICLN